MSKTTRNFIGDFDVVRTDAVLPNESGDIVFAGSRPRCDPIAFPVTDPDHLVNKSYVDLLGGGGGAPADASFVVISSDPTLTNERVLTGTADQITVTDGGAGNPVTISIPSSVSINTLITQRPLCDEGTLPTALANHVASKAYVDSVAGGGSGYTSANTRVRLTPVSTISCASGVSTDIVFDIVEYDDDGSGGTRYNTGTGRYTNSGSAFLGEITASVGFTNPTAGGAGTPIILEIVVGATSRQFAVPAIQNGGRQTVNGSIRINVSAGQDILVRVQQSSGEAISVGNVGNLQTMLEIRSVGPSV